MAANVKAGVASMAGGNGECQCGSSAAISSACGLKISMASGESVINGVIMSIENNQSA